MTWLGRWFNKCMAAAWLLLVPGGALALGFDYWPFMWAPLLAALGAAACGWGWVCCALWEVLVSE